MSVPRSQLEYWLQGLNIKADKVIDIGGSQKTMEKRVKSWEVNEYMILDLSKPHETEREPDIKADLNILNVLANNSQYERYFDLAFCIEVFDYIWNPLGALQNIAYCLKKDSLLYASFNFNYPIHNPVEDDALRYTRRAIEKLMHCCAFEVVDITPRTCEMNTGHPELMEFYAKQRMRKANSHKGHNETGFLVTAKKIS